MIVDYIDAHRHRFGVEPICAALRAEGITIAPSGYYAAKKRPPSRRSLSDAALAEKIEATFWDREKGRGVYGARKMWHQLRRDRVTGPVGRPIALHGGTADARAGLARGPPWAAGADHPGGPPQRTRARPGRPQLHPAAPNRLGVVDLTYVPTWSEMVFTAFVSDVFSRRIVGWRCATSMPTQLPLDALEMALWTREQQVTPVKVGWTG